MIAAMPPSSAEPPPAAAPGRRFRAAVVGTGGIVSDSHLPALAAHADEVALVAAVDVDEQRLDAFRGTAAERLGLADPADLTGYLDLAAMLEAERPDLVLIGTPPALHREQTVAALRAGAWVLSEKPFCLNLAEYDEIAAAEGPEGQGPFASVVFQHRYGSGTVHARRLLGADGASAEGGRGLGRPLVAHCQTTWYRDEAYYSVPWRGTWASEGGGPTMGHGIHQMDLLLHLLGPWEEVRAMASRLVHDVQSEDVSTALVRFRSGAVATVVNSVLSPDEVSRIRIDCTEATVELTHLYGHTNADWVYTPAPHRADDAELLSHWRNPPTDTPSSHGAQLADVLSAMRSGHRPDSSGADSRRLIELLAAVYKAAFTGRPVQAGEITPDDPYYAAMHGGAPERLHPTAAENR
jgi:predicted dehydrogenase